MKRGKAWNEKADDGLRTHGRLLDQFDLGFQKSHTSLRKDNWEVYMAGDKVLTGAAGEYYVAFRLAAVGYAVGLTTRGTRTIDLIVANVKTAKSIIIQTKTMLNASAGSKRDAEYWWKWRLGVSAKPVEDTFFYAFVDLKDDAAKVPDVFIVPSSEVGELVGDWTNDDGKLVDRWVDIIKGSDKETKYRNRWDIFQKALG